MTVKELREQLAHCNDEDTVFFEFSSGDYVGTVLATEVTSIIAEPALVDTAQYPGYKKVVDSEKLDDYDESEFTPNAVMLTD